MEEQPVNVGAEAPPPMPAVWFVAVNNERKGPLTVSDISQMAAEGAVDRFTLAWKKGMGEWAPISQIPELGPVFASRVAIDPEKFQRALDVSKRSSKEAFGAFQKFIINPLSGLPATYQALGKTGALSVSIVFLIAYEILAFFGFGVFNWHGVSIVDYAKLVLALAVPYGGIMLSMLLIRVIRKPGETWHADLYIASAAALLGGIGIALGGVMGVANFEFAMILVLIEFCLLVYILHSGLERIYKYSETFTIWIIPVVIVFSVWLSKLIMVRILQDFANPFFANMGHFMM